MESIDINTLFHRNEIVDDIKKVLTEFDTRCNELTYKKGIYLYGSPGSGKTYFITEILTELGFDIVKYDAGDIRNKALIETMTCNNISNRNVLDMMTKRNRKIAIVMDEIDGMNSGDKGGLNALIKLIRQKKTKKQKTESKTMNPIICIGNYYTDKKMRELMKVCNVFELKTPTKDEIQDVILKTLHTKVAVSANEMDILQKYIQGDMRKLKFTINILNKNTNFNGITDLLQIFHTKNYNDEPKTITNHLLEKKYEISQHNFVMNETDRTIVALLWHENIIDKITTVNAAQAFPLYYKILRNICFADYIDRITFQSQIWQFNEMSSLVKTFYNNKLYHDYCQDYTLNSIPEIRFTKVLTKYSTEYNNSLFIQNLSQNLSMDKRDIMSFFQEIRLCIGKNFNNDTELLLQVEQIFDDYSINKLDIKRIYRFLDKNSKKDELCEDVEDDL
jgi:hypothetical protein